MAGDWIKMRGNLWDDPRVSAIVDATDTSEAAVIGGLYWLWATADQHTEDGIMPGLTLRQIDRKTGVPGLGAALVSVGWLADHPEGVRIVKFTEHNGASAKRRSSDAQRKASVRNVSASDADKEKTGGGVDEDELRRLAELEKEKRREETSSNEDVQRATPGEACKAMKSAGMSGCNPSSPKLVEMLNAGITVAELAFAAAEAVQRGKGFAYALAAAEGRRRDSATAPLPNAVARNAGRHSAAAAAIFDMDDDLQPAPDYIDV